MDLWHKRFGHVAKNVIQMISKGHVKGLDANINRNVVKCNACVDAKQTRTAHKGFVGAEDEEHIIHFDNIGRIEIPSEGGSWYILSMTVEKYPFGKAYKIK